MRKILAAGIFLVLGSLVSMHVQAQATVSAPFLEQLQIKESTAQKIVAAEQKARDLQMLARELEQLQVFLKNLKRASPKLWDSSLNAFENLANLTDPIDTFASVVKDAGGLLERSGCADGILKSAQPSTSGSSIEINPGASPEAQVESYRRGQLRRRCKQLLTTLETEERVAKRAAESKVALDKQAKNKDAGSNEIMDSMLDELTRTRIQMMQEQREVTREKQEAIQQEFAEAAQRQAIHDRLMKSPSSAKKIKGRDPALTIDPRNY